MRLVINKLGQLQDVSLHIRPLTVLVGKNNTNKTWAAYALYALAQSLSARLYHWGTYSSAVGDLGIPSTLSERIDRTVDDVIDKQRASNTESSATTVYRNELLDSLVLSDPVRFTLGNDALRGLLAAQPDASDSAHVALEVEKKTFLHEGKNPSLAITLNQKNGTLVFELPSRGPFAHGMSVGTSPQYFQQGQHRSNLYSYVRWLALGIQGNVLAFPSERKGLWTIANQLKKDSLRGKLAVPVADFVQFVQIANQRNSIGDQRRFRQFIELLSSKVLGGTIEYVGSAEDKELCYTGKDAPQLRMQSAASIVRSLSSLGVYLWTFAEPGDLIIIDEPEMNAHPDAQLSIMEFLALLANSGFKVVITTHSPYLTDHLNNLMEASKLAPTVQQSVADRFKLADPRVFISPEKVAAYWFTDDGAVQNVLDEAQGITEMETFADASDYVSNLYADLLETHDAEAPHAI